METLILFRLTLIICFLQTELLSFPALEPASASAGTRHQNQDIILTFVSFFCGCVFFELGMMGHNDDDEDEEKESGDGGGERKKCR